MICDLHCHTKLSDGSLGIEDVIAQAKRMNIDFLSITDHDTMASFQGQIFSENVTELKLSTVSNFQHGTKKEILKSMFFAMLQKNLTDLKVCALNPVRSVRNAQRK